MAAPDNPSPVSFLPDASAKPYFGARPSFWISFLLVSITFSVYFQVRHFDFINFDDPAYVTANSHVLKGLTADSLKWMLLGEVGSNWHPLTMLSHMLDVTLYGVNPGAHHWTNIQFHLINTILLFLVFYRLQIGLWTSAFTAAVFALHPLHVESIAWISERKDVLSTCLWLLTMLCYIGYTRRPGRLRYWSTVVLFTIGLTAKPMLVTLPFVLLLIDYWPLQRAIRSRKDLVFVWIEKIPFLLITVCFSIITYFIQELTGAVTKLGPLPWFVRAANAVVSYVTYLKQTFWPVSLSVFYPYPKTFDPWDYIGSAIIILCISIFFWFYRKVIPWGFVGWFWFIGTLVPVIGFVQVGLQAHADRYMYIPMTGLILLLSCAAGELIQRFRKIRPLLWTIGIGSISALAISTYNQTAYWKNSLTLFSQAAKNTHDNATAYFCIAAYYQANDNPIEAETFYQKALQLTPNDPMIHINLIALYEKMGKVDFANEHFNRLITCPIRGTMFQKHLGRLYIERNDWSKAKEQLSAAIKIDPSDAVSHAHLGIAEAELGNLHNSLSLLKHASRLDPNNAMIQNNLAVNYRKLGRIPDAVVHFGRALSMEPANTDYLDRYRGILKEQKRLTDKLAGLTANISSNLDQEDIRLELASIYGLLQQREKELEVLEETVRIHPTSQRGLARLGIALATRGRYEEAMEQFLRLSVLDSGNPEWHYRIATLWARMKDAPNACFSLQTALDKGYADTSSIFSDPNLEFIRDSSCYIRIVAGLEQTASGK